MVCCPSQNCEYKFCSAASTGSAGTANSTLRDGAASRHPSSANAFALRSLANWWTSWSIDFVACKWQPDTEWLVSVAIVDPTDKRSVKCGTCANIVVNSRDTCAITAHFIRPKRPCPRSTFTPAAYPGVICSLMFGVIIRLISRWRSVA